MNTELEERQVELETVRAASASEGEAKDRVGKLEEMLEASKRALARNTRPSLRRPNRPLRPQAHR